MKKNGKGSKTDKSDFEQKTRVLLEDIRHSVQTVAEGRGGIVKRLDKIESELSSVKSELHTVKLAVMDTNHCTDRIEKKVDEALENHEKRIAKLEEKVLV